MSAPDPAPKSPLLRLSDYLPFHLVVTANAVSNVIGGAYRARFGLTVWHWRVLCALGAEGSMTAQDIVAMSAMDKVTVSRAVLDLRRRGLIQRSKSKSDARAFDLHLTKYGKTVYEEIVPVALGFQDQILSRLSANERTQLMHLLKTVCSRARELTPDE
jgi:DNA-binding MarR family transcriptional regulator